MDDGQEIRNTAKSESASSTNRGTNLSETEAHGRTGPRNAPMTAYWDIRQLASYLNVKPSTLYAWASQGRIPCFKLHGLVRFRREDIERWIDSCRLTANLRSDGAPCSRCPSGDVDTLIVRAKRQAYNPAPRGNQTEIKPHRKGGA